ncbi:Regulating synaptic membrane exocytosis protein 2, partial [Pseudolycoriella hygida]
RKQDEVAVLENTIRERSEQQKKAGVELDATCHICLKTKFADGVGHMCHYCNIRCCARCGGKVTLRSTKMIWVCILCRKKQELLSKTGQWINKVPESNSYNRRVEPHMSGSSLPDPQDQSDKRPKLERARSAAEKENQPLQRSGSQLRRQYSQQEPTRRMSSEGAECSITSHQFHAQHPVQHTHSSMYPDDDPKYYQGELDGLMRQHPHLVHPRQQQLYSQQKQLDVQHHSLPQPVGHSSDVQKKHKRPLAGPHLTQQRSFSSSDEELRSTPDFDAATHIKLLNHSRLNLNPIDNLTKLDVNHRNYNRSNHQRHPINQKHFLTTEQSLATYDRYPIDPDPYWDEQADTRRFTERRKKTVRFDGQDSDDWGRWETERQGSQDSATKDSGIETSSTFTSSEDSNRGDGPKNPVNWQVSSDGLRVIGHMILRKNIEGEDILGLKVVGGQILSNGRIGAIIEKVKRGSIADQEGRIRPGDEVIEWNGRPLHGLSSDDVHNIVADSRQESQVELILSRLIAATNRRAVQSSWIHSHSPTRFYHKESYDHRRDKPAVLVTSPGSPDIHISGRGTSAQTTRYANRLTPAGPIPVESNVGGRVQIKLGYEAVSLQLIVTIICAKGLTFRANGASRNPYLKIYLLPDRGDISKRRTTTLASTNDPRWGQTFIYSGFRRTDLNNRVIEITAWDYIRFGANHFLGEVVLGLSNHPLDDEPEWYTLQSHYDSHSSYHLRRDDDMEMILTPTDHLSPPSTTSRLSDSDTTSECDIDGITASRDGASISSLGSSSSPPPEAESLERRSRRDMSPQGRKRATAMVARDCRTVSGIGQSYHNNQVTSHHIVPPRNSTMSLNQRSHSAAPSEHYRSSSPRRGSLSPPDERYGDYPALPMQQYGSRFQSRSATATPTGSPKKRHLPQVPQVPHTSNTRSALRERLAQDFEERGVGRFSRHRARQTHHQHQQTYRSTGMGGWERHYAGLSDSDLTMHSLEPRLRPRHSLSPDKDFMGDFADSDMESVVSVTSSAFSTQSERPRGSRGL